MTHPWAAVLHWATKSYVQSVRVSESDHNKIVEVALFLQDTINGLSPEKPAAAKDIANITVWYGMVWFGMVGQSQ